MASVEQVFARAGLLLDPTCRRLLPIVSAETGMSSSGYPYLERAAWEDFRDHVPHILGMGAVILRATETIETAFQAENGDEADNVRRACSVLRQIVLTAGITAPPDLWLMRHVLDALRELGLLSRLLEGDALYPASCTVERNGTPRRLDADELRKDLLFLLSRGVVEQYEDSFRISGHPKVRRILEELGPPPVHRDVAAVWTALFAGRQLSVEDQEALLNVSFSVARGAPPAQNHWIPTLEEIELGFRLVPVVLGLRAAERTTTLRAGTEVEARDLSLAHPQCAAGALEVLTAAGWMQRAGERYEVTPIGARGFARGAGPFGIIHTYHPYMTRAVEILVEGRGRVWVQRGDNVAASQDANRGTFEKANDALDRFCEDTGFTLGVFIEHAIGRGEATRQRYERPGGDQLRYFGADLEDAAIDAAIAEQKDGKLPSDMVFVRNADIGEPRALLQALRDHDADPEGAVMLVGNGFHEIRDQTDEGMVEVFQRYHDAGIILLFTEENALSIDDLRATAWNTYHAGFKYVHEKSGQGLRPAYPRAPIRLGDPLRTAWSECAQRAGYIRATKYSSRTRTVYPYPPPSGYNPAISVSHFFVPGPIADRLGLEARTSLSG